MHVFAPRKHPGITGAPRDLLVFTVASAALVTATALASFFLRTGGDFRMFYDSGQAWHHGASAYSAAHANLNPPLVVAVLFHPLSFLPYPIAQLVWSVASVLAAGAAVRLIARELALSSVATVQLVALIALTYASWLAWFQGQIVWLLLYPFTRAWLALRARQLVPTGAWLAIVVAVKPPLALLVLVLPFPVWLTAGIGSATLTLVGVLWGGVHETTAWLRMSDAVHWLSWPDNVSAWGVIARMQSWSVFGGAMVDLSLLAFVVILILTVAGWCYLQRVRNMDRRLTLGLLWVLAVTPLGWVYYLPLIAGPAAATWRASRWSVSALTLFSIPLPLLFPLLMTPLGALVLGPALQRGPGLCVDRMAAEHT